MCIYVYTYMVLYITETVATSKPRKLRVLGPREVPTTKVSATPAAPLPAREDASSQRNVLPLLVPLNPLWLSKGPHSKTRRGGYRGRTGGYLGRMSLVGGSIDIYAHCITWILETASRIINAPRTMQASVVKMSLLGIRNSLGLWACKCPKLFSCDPPLSLFRIRMLSEQGGTYVETSFTSLRLRNSQSCTNALAWALQSPEEVGAPRAPSQRYSTGRQGPACWEFPPTLHNQQLLTLTLGCGPPIQMSIPGPHGGDLSLCLHLRILLHIPQPLLAVSTPSWATFVLITLLRRAKTRCLFMPL